MTRKPRRDDPVTELKREAEWSSFTNSWNRAVRGWHWPLSLRLTLVVLMSGALLGAMLWLVVQVLMRAA
jgi:hypothetical protein